MALAGLCDRVDRVEAVRMILDDHLTTRQVAEKMSCSQDTVLRLAQRGDIESVFWGRERRYPAAGIQRYLDRSKRRTTDANVVELRRAK